MTTATVRADGLGKRYREHWALRECTFELRPGRVTALVGANGAGKTTLLTLLAGLLAPDEGTVDIGGRSAFVAHDKPLYKHLTAEDMLNFGRRLNKTWDSERAERWLERFKVPLDRQCGKLSAGQQAQVAFAVAIGAKPDVLLLDEPLANLDPLIRRDVMTELLAEVADSGMSVVLSTHVVSELSGVADELLLLSHGKLVLDGDLDELMAGHVHYVGPRAEAPPFGEVVQANHHQLQSSFVVRVNESHVPQENWVTRPVTVEDIVLAHLTRAGGVQ